MNDTPPHITGQAQADEIDLNRIITTLWRGKWYILGTALLGAIVATYYSLAWVAPMYPAHATIALEPTNDPIISDIESLFSTGGTDLVTINTEIEVFRSRRLIGDLVDDLDLIADPEFNRHLRERAGFGAWVFNIFRGGDRALPPLPTDIVRRGVIDALVTRIGVVNRRQSLVFNLSIDTTDPEKSAQIVNRLAELYIDAQIRRKLESTERAITFLSERTSTLGIDLQRREQEFARILERSNVVSPEIVQTLNLQLRDLRERIEEQQEQRAQDAAIIAAFDTAEDIETMLAMAEASDETRLMRIVRQYRAGQLDEGSTRFAMSEIIADLTRAVARSEQQIATLDASARELAARINLQSEELIALQQMERELASTRLLYETFLARLQEVNVQQGLETADARILSHAVPRGASRPRTSRNRIMGAMIGALLGAFGVLVREWLFAGFRTKDELYSATNKPVVGMIPHTSGKDHAEILVELTHQSNSVFSEAVRNLRTSILLSNVDRAPQVIMFTSSIPDEGKTTTAMATARSFSAIEGQKTLLLEADIRRNALLSVAGAGNASVVDIMVNRSKLDDLHLFNADLGVDVLVGGKSDINPADLFASRRFSEFIAALRARYNYIIIDTPPVLAVPDARVIAQYADAIIFAVKWSDTTRTQVHQGLDMLSSVGFPATGLILSQIDTQRMKSYGYGGQYGYDGYSAGYYTA